MKAVIIRLDDGTDIQSLGRFELFDGVNLKFQCKTLELPDKGNKNNISRIPEGTYQVKRRTSKKFGEHFHVLDVPGRELILIHPGNYYKQTEGCILLGQDYVDINKDGQLDVTISRPTLKRLLDRVPKSFQLRVVDIDK